MKWFSFYSIVFIHDLDCGVINRMNDFPININRMNRVNIYRMNDFSFLQCFQDLK